MVQEICCRPWNNHRSLQVPVWSNLETLIFLSSRFIFRSILFNLQDWFSMKFWRTFFRKCFSICFTNRNWMQVGKTEFFLLLRKMSFSYVWCLCTMIPLEKIMSLNQRHLLIFPLVSQENQRCITGISPHQMKQHIPPSNETTLLRSPFIQL